jgi:hypothetical protein
MKFSTKTNFILLVILFIFSFSALAQDTLRKKRFYLGFSYTAAYYKIFDQDDKEKLFYGDAFYTDQFYNQYRLTYIPYRFGLDLKWVVSKHISFSTGFLVEERTAEYNVPFDRYGNKRKVKMVSTHTQLAVPLRMDIRFSKKPVSLFFTLGGLSTLFLRNTRYSVEPPIPTVKYHYYFHRNDRGNLRAFFQCGFGLDANIKRTKIQIFPLYEFNFFRKIFIPGYYYTHSIGGVLSVSWRL